MFRVKSTIETLRTLDKKLDEEKRFAFTRYGDGELMMMEGWEGYSGNHTNSDELQNELLEAFQIEDENYLIALGCGTRKEADMKDGVFNNYRKDGDLCDTVRNNSDKEIFHNAFSLHYSALFKERIFKPFWDKIGNKKILFVGGSHLKDIRADYHVETPVSQAYEAINSFYPEIVKNIGKVDVVLLSVGICTSVIQKRLWSDGYKVITLDIGSLFDGILGIQSRQWIKETDNELLKKYL